MGWYARGVRGLKRISAKWRMGTLDGAWRTKRPTSRWHAHARREVGSRLLQTCDELLELRDGAGKELLQLGDEGGLPGALVVFGGLLQLAAEVVE